MYLDGIPTYLLYTNWSKPQTSDGSTKKAENDEVYLFGK